eukprot:g21586.t1
MQKHNSTLERCSGMQSFHKTWRPLCCFSRKQPRRIWTQLNSSLALHCGVAWELRWTCHKGCNTLRKQRSMGLLKQSVLILGFVWLLLPNYSLGVMHELGEGVPRSDTQAQHWFRTAAAQGSLEAQARVRSPGLLPPPSA